MANQSRSQKIDNLRMRARASAIHVTQIFIDRFECAAFLSGNLKYLKIFENLKNVDPLVKYVNVPSEDHMIKIYIFF